MKAFLFKILLLVALTGTVFATTAVANEKHNTIKTTKATKKKNTESTTTKSTDTLFDTLSPKDSELSIANKKLLAKNAELSFAVDNLTTQVNVLTQERSGQLFTYGAMTAIFSMIIGFVLAKFIGKNNRW